MPFRFSYLTAPSTKCNPSGLVILLIPITHDQTMKMTSPILKIFELYCQYDCCWTCICKDFRSQLPNLVVTGVSDLEAQILYNTRNYIFLGYAWYKSFKLEHDVHICYNVIQIEIL